MKNKIEENKNILEISNLNIDYPMARGYFRAVENASLTIKEGEIVGLVGESGSGKSTIGRTILGLNSFSAGKVIVNGIALPNNKNNISKEDKASLVKSCQYIFQDPAGALNPNKTIRKALSDVYDDNFKYKKYILQNISKIVDKYFKNSFYQNIFKEEFSKFKKNSKNKLTQKTEDQINKKFFIELNNIYINFRSTKADLQNAQRAKVISDKVFLEKIRKLRKELKERKENLKNETNEELSKLVNKENLGDKFLQNKKALRKKIINLVYKDKLNEQSFERILKGEVEKKDWIDLIPKILKAKNQLVFVEKNKLKNDAIDISVAKASLDPGLLNKKPKTLSGGQQQRVLLARALLVEPKLLVADEPIAALDVSIQSHVINAFKKLRETENISILFIAHDLNIVRNISDRIIIMYRGQILEEGMSEEIFKNPLHPYTKMLLKSIPEITDPILRSPKLTKYSLENREWFNYTKTHKIFCTEKEFKKLKGGS